MKIFLFWDYYEPYLNTFETRFNGLSDKNYREHSELLFDDYFGIPSSLRNYLRASGNECELFVGNYYRLQQKWCNENKINITASAQTKREIVLKQLESFKPDVFFISSMFEYYGDFLSKVRNTTPNIFGWIGCPFNRELNFSNIRCIITPAESFLDIFRKLGVNSELLKVAFDQEISNRLKDVPKTTDIGFIGSVSKANHKFRVEALEKIASLNMDLKVWGYGLKKSKFPFFQNPLQRCFQGDIWGIDMYKALAGLNITLNFHIDIIKPDNQVGNMRMFEATGCGSMLLTDTGSNIKDYFVPGKEIETYTTLNELIEKVYYYLDHPDDCKKITDAGREACLSRHSWKTRIKEIESIFIKYSI
ncbi:MAG: glycosyltransferase [FCB group bacterium]|jgi:glycosyltransferase involved in cell wall biosynthesis